MPRSDDAALEYKNIQDGGSPLRFGPDAGSNRITTESDPIYVTCLMRPGIPYMRGRIR